MEPREVLNSLRENNRALLIVGLGISGIETAKFCLRSGISVIAAERTSREDFISKGKFLAELAEIERQGVQVHFGVDGEGAAGLVERAGLVVMSPGVSFESAIAGALRRRPLPIIGELELGLGLLDQPSVVVTGSNGKSTTVSLLDHFALQAGINSFLCGNVGCPVISAVPGLGSDAKVTRDPAPEILVVEASSYQLESCSVIRPKVGVLLNLTENHLERHGSMQRYFEAKAILFSNQQPGDYAVLNYDDRWCRELGSRLKASVYWFGTDPALKQQRSCALINYEGGACDEIFLEIDGGRERYDLHSSRLIGLHNRYNLAAAILSARLLGVRAEAIAAGLRSFTPLEHRLEFVAVPSGAAVINDSKSTTVAAAVAAFRCVDQIYPGRRIICMIGGLAKAGSWQGLMTAFKQRAGYLKPIILFGKDAGILAAHCKAAGLPHLRGANLSSAVELARAQTEGDDIVLFTPGCASFDEFLDFEERGRCFKKLVVEVFR
ncbi:MAG: UDP-N-acetylmuramoyl-L-alanine--D-glutamate ligase [Proteobacteria bacterium]|nr:MAG: UDP-N-acetylmuramoyl-L-alanine--D-glutamate ligase [Pseudomonadota bacterium]